jgi:hypothetical protein
MFWFSVSALLRYAMHMNLKQNFNKCLRLCDHPDENKEHSMILESDSVSFPVTLPCSCTLYKTKIFCFFHTTSCA